MAMHCDKCRLESTLENPVKRYKKASGVIPTPEKDLCDRCMGHVEKAVVAAFERETAPIADQPVDDSCEACHAARVKRYASGLAIYCGASGERRDRHTEDCAALRRKANLPPLPPEPDKLFRKPLPYLTQASDALCQIEGARDALSDAITSLGRSLGQARDAVLDAPQQPDPCAGCEPGMEQCHTPCMSVREGVYCGRNRKWIDKEPLKHGTNR